MSMDAQVQEGKQAILDAAALCFMEQGYHATSIDDVARRLRATKGRVYHYYPAKIDLYFDVHREGMRRLFAAVEPSMAGSGDGLVILRAMLRAHANAMLEHHVYESAVMQGVQIHRFGATTPSQRQELDELMASRDRFEGLFKAQVERAKEEGFLIGLDTSVTVKMLLGALQWSVVWYRPERTDDAASRDALAEAMVRTLMQGMLPRP